MIKENWVRARVIFFLFIVFIVVLASFFASSHPDGLEKVAARLCFIGQGVERSALLGDYSVVSGILGIVILFSLFYFVARFFPRFDLK